MPRPRRPELAGGLHHVTAHGNDTQLIFRDTADRRLFLKILRTVLVHCEWTCLTYCLMDNHYHLLVGTPLANLAAGMQRLNGGYAQRFNRRHGRRGHLWAGRYHSVLVENDAQFLVVTRYIALNPVKAGLCARPDDWGWGGHRALAGLDPAGLVAATETLSRFAADGGNGRDRYLRFVAGAT